MQYSTAVFKRFHAGITYFLQICNRVINLTTATMIVILMAIMVLMTTSCKNMDKSGYSGKNNKSAPFEVGAAMVDITPPPGFPQYRGESTGVASPLYAKALVFKQGDTHAALVVCDLIRITRGLSRIVREKASKQTGIPFQNISITATHTHTGPRYMQQMQEYADREAAGKLTKEDRSGYLSDLANGIAEAIVSANKQLQTMETISGIGRAKGISFNRRFLMTNGRVRFNPGYLNPRIVRPVGPIDPNVHFLMFKPTGQDNYSASLTSFANHTDTYGGTEFHADYPFYLQENLKEMFGEQFISVFGNGTCGDINHVDVTRPAGATQKGAITKKIGEKLAETIKENISGVKQYKPDLQVISKTIYLPLQDFTEKEYEWAMDKNASPLYADRSWLIGRRRGKILSLDQMRRREAIQPTVSGEPWRLPIEIHVFCLDAQTAIVTMPGEVFVELGLELKESSPFANTFVIEMANSNIHYVPTLRGFAEGDYEAMNSRLAPGSGEEMVEEALKMLNVVHSKQQ